MTSRPFRFAVQGFEATSAADWFDLARRSEDLGYTTLFSSDHYFGPGTISESTGHRPVDLAPLTSIAMAAARTTMLRVGCRVFACDYHHPVVLAKEMATLDLLSDGRLEVGLGAGWVAAEYEGLGVLMASAGARIDKLVEYVDLLRAHWTGEPIKVSGKYVDVSGFAGRPARPSPPPIMIGGGAPKVLGVAGRLADIVSLNFDNRTGRLGSASIASSGADQTAEKIGWIRDGAGARFDQLELEIGAYFVSVGPDAGRALEAMAGRFGVTPAEFASHPHALFGTADTICDVLRERRERYGISYITVAQRNVDEFAPVVAALAGT